MSIVPTAFVVSPFDAYARGVPALRQRLAANPVRHPEVLAVSRTSVSSSSITFARLATVVFAAAAHLGEPRRSRARDSRLLQSVGSRHRVTLLRRAGEREGSGGLRGFFREAFTGGGNKQVNALEQALEAQKSRTKEIEKMMDELSAKMQQELQEERQANEVLRGDIITLTSQIQTMQSSYSDLNDQLEMTQQNAQKEVTGLQRDLSDVKSEAKKNSAAAVESARLLTQAQSKLQAADQNARRLAAKKNELTEDLLRQQKELDVFAERLSSESSKLQTEMQRSARLQKQVEDLLKRNAELEQKLTQVEGEKMQLVQKVAKIETVKNQLQTRVTHLEGETGKLQERIVVVEGENDQLRQDMSKYRTQNLDLQAKYAVVAQERDYLRATLQQAVTSRMKAEHALAALQKKLSMQTAAPPQAAPPTPNAMPTPNRGLSQAEQQRLQSLRAQEKKIEQQLQAALEQEKQLEQRASTHMNAATTPQNNQAATAEDKKLTSDIESSEQRLAELMAMAEVLDKAEAELNAKVASAQK